jgi:hypothetical protein
MVWVGVGRVVLLVGVALALATGATGCSAQKPGSKVDGSHSENKLELDRSLALSVQPSRSTVRIDYLRHLADIQNPEVFVYKERRRLYVVDTNVVVRDYPVGLGKQPWGDKEREGDGRTPEGAFMVFTKNSLPDHGLGLKMRKPAVSAAKSWPVAGRVPQVQFRHLAATSDRRSSKVSQSGWTGQFSIHGGGAQADWTDGSVALYPSDMEELSQVVGLGTPVIVRP